MKTCKGISYKALIRGGHILILEDDVIKDLVSRHSTLMQTRENSFILKSSLRDTHFLPKHFLDREIKKITLAISTFTEEHRSTLDQFSTDL